MHKNPQCNDHHKHQPYASKRSNHQRINFTIKRPPLGQTHHGRRGSRSYARLSVDSLKSSRCCWYQYTRTQAHVRTQMIDCMSVWWPWLYLRRRKRHITFNLPPLRSTPTSRSALVICDPKRDKNAVQWLTPSDIRHGFTTEPSSPTSSCQACISVFETLLRYSRASLWLNVVWTS